VARRGAVEPGEQPLPPPVGDFKQQRGVALRRIDRLQDVQVGAKVDALVSPARRQCEIDNPLVAGMLRVDRERNATDQPFVRPGLAERLTAGHDAPCGDRDAYDFGRCRPSSQREDQQSENAVTHR